MSIKSRSSFADDPEGVPSVQSEVADDLHAFLVQFFTLFPEYRGNEFYAFGQSYGGEVCSNHRQAHSRDEPGLRAKDQSEGTGNRKRVDGA